ncbi:MAG: hypothetical protein HW393_182, partial [Dehalococcoidia bacterium]|nr:hypothetical protein [Dehalococcoidia bacterium]
DLYELRSKVVHGSRVRECSVRHYERLLQDTLFLLNEYLQLVTADGSITTPAKAIRAMEQAELLRLAIQWFAKFRGKSAREIVGVAREMLAAREARG